jgi:DNA repair exonuclease SbcCD ATPase subunit
MQMISIEVNNVLRVKAVYLEPDGSVTLIGGKNKAGKSSVLTAIEMCLGGADAIPPEPLRKGATKGHARLDLGDIVVTRSFTARGTTLNIKTADGETVKSPQELLNSLIGRISFDPSEFSRLDPKARMAMLQTIVGIDFSAIDKKRNETFVKRTEVGRRLKEAEARLKTSVFYPDAPKEEVSAADLLEEMNKRQAHNAENALALSKVQKQHEIVEQAGAELKSAETAIANAEKALEDAKEEFFTCQKVLDASVRLCLQMQEAANLLQDQDVAEIKDKIAASDEINKKVRANFARNQETAAVRKLDADHDALTAYIESCNETKEEMLATAKFPIEGLGLSDAGVTFNGLPFEQCSSAESIEVSMAIGLALNPKLPVVLIKHGSLIDDEQLEVVRRIAEAHKAQVIIERVGGGDECAVIIEDGHIAGEEMPEDVEFLAGQEAAAAVEGSGEGP